MTARLDREPRQVVMPRPAVGSGPCAVRTPRCWSPWATPWPRPRAAQGLTAKRMPSGRASATTRRNTWSGAAGGGL